MFSLNKNTTTPPSPQVLNLSTIKYGHMPVKMMITLVFEIAADMDELVDRFVALKTLSFKTEPIKNSFSPTGNLIVSVT